MTSNFSLVGYLLLFTAVGIGFLLFNLLVGKLVRPSLPNPEKDSIYECGEPTIGSSWIQFDLRFCVVALLFIIFDVEVAFFFPWAVVYGKANQVTAAARAEDIRTVSTKTSWYSAVATFPEAASTPPTILGIPVVLNRQFPGSSRSGEKARKKSRPQPNPLPSRMGRSSSSVVVG